MRSPIAMVRFYRECRWAMARMSTYLDADPSAPMTPEEIARLEDHVRICEMCTRYLDEHRLVRAAVSRFAGVPRPAPAALARVRHYLDELVREGERPG